MNASDEEIRMQIGGMVLDPDSNVPIVILKDPVSESLLPIWIGLFEANAIAMTLEGVAVPRPMTHDLLLTVIQSLQGEVEKVVITDLKESTFYAQIHLKTAAGSLLLDGRPSDAIALALRAGVPFFVLNSVLSKAKVDDRLNKLTENERLKKWLEEVDPDDLGKYTM
jgi:bifunctional DNase/RNase